MSTRTAVVAAALAGLALGCGSGGNECAACIDEKCSDLLAVCNGDADCACVASCTGDNGIPGIDACLATCGLSERPAGFAALEVCVATACPDTEDECSTPSDYQPPDALTCDGTGGGIGSGSLADCSFDTGLAFDPDGAVLQLESADHSVCLRLERRDDGPGSLANIQWTLLDVRVGPTGEVALVDDAAAICWYSSHHNFRDIAHAWTGTRHYEYVFEQGPIDAATCSASIADFEDSVCIEGPIELFPVNP